MNVPIVAVVGLSYVGISLAVEFGKKYETIGYDLSEAKIAQFKNYCAPTGNIKHGRPEGRHPAHGQHRPQHDTPR